MFTNTKVTLYNRYLDSNNNYQYKRTVLDSVHWESIRARSKHTFGAEANDTAKISIPFSVDSDSEFISSKRFNALEHKTGYFTFNEEDKIVKGVISESVSFDDLETNYDDVVTITSIDTADYGSKNMHHWELSCK